MPDVDKLRPRLLGTGAAGAGFSLGRFSGASAPPPVNANRKWGQFCRLKTGPRVVVLLCLKLGSGLVPEAVAAAGEVQDFCVVNDPVDHRRSHCGVAEDLAPPAEREVAGEHQGSVFIAGRDELEEQVA